MKSDQVLFAERVPDCGQVQDNWREVMEINTERAFFFFGPSVEPLFGITILN